MQNTVETTVFPMILVRSAGLPLPAGQLAESALPDFNHLNDRVLQMEVLLRSSFDNALQEIPTSDLRTNLYNARKAFFQKRKTPTHALQAEWAANEKTAGMAELLGNLKRWDALQQEIMDAPMAYSRLLNQEFQRLQTLASGAELQRGLLFASHDLLKHLPAFCAKDSLKFDKKDRQIALSVLQYHTRGNFKTSPLSRFTNVGLWRPGRPAEPDFFSDKIAVTPNVAILPWLYEVLLKEPAFYRSLSVKINPSIAQDIDFQHLYWLYFDGEQEAFQQLAPNPAAALVLTILSEAGRKLPFQALSAALLDAIDATPEAVEALLLQLAELGMLEWEFPEMGLTPSWTSNLATYLAHLPSVPLFTEVAFLLQSLRSTARILPFQPLEEALQTMGGAAQQIADFLEKQAFEAPAIPPEQVFFEDVEHSIALELPETTVQSLVNQLSDCWKSREKHKLPPFRARLLSFANASLQQGQVIDFQLFCQSFFAWNGPVTAQYADTYAGKLGAMIQIFNEDGANKAVVNAMFPGGGKLFSRWLHLFPTAFSEALREWNQNCGIPFPWQGWSNANFQPATDSGALAAPGGRVGGAPKNAGILLADIAVKFTGQGLTLIDKKSGNALIFNDMGLESPDSKPPVIQVLWHLGVPHVSSISLLPEENRRQETSMGGLVVQHCPRLEYESLVLARASWTIPVVPHKMSHADHFFQHNGLLRQLGVPRFFFARQAEGRHKPQFFDRDSPVSMLLFEKMLDKCGDAGLYIEEMLPTPDQWVVGASEKKAAEFIVEFIP